MLEIFDHEGLTLAELKPEVQLGDVRDAKDAVANASYLEASHLLVAASQLPEGFFDLTTGVAGEILQTAASFRVELVVMGDFSGVTSNAFQALIVESNRNGPGFVADRETALEQLAWR